MTATATSSPALPTVTLKQVEALRKIANAEPRGLPSKDEAGRVTVNGHLWLALSRAGLAEWRGTGAFRKSSYRVSRYSPPLVESHEVRHMHITELGAAVLAKHPKVQEKPRGTMPTPPEGTAWVITAGGEDEQGRRFREYSAVYRVGPMACLTAKDEAGNYIRHRVRLDGGRSADELEALADGWERMAKGPASGRPGFTVRECQHKAQELRQRAAALRK